MLDKVKQAGQLWWQGVWESLQLQRCVVFFVLDSSSNLWGKVFHCFVLNGFIFLGSIAWWAHVLYPSIHWLLMTTLQPLLGDWVTYGLEATFKASFQALWLFPAYVVTVLVSCIWYQEVATLAYNVKQQQVQLDPGKGHATRNVRAKGKQLEDVAQELYRAILFVVFYAEVWLISNLPYVGPVLNFFLLSWLYAYYCYDYKWSLQAVRLTDRLAYFEQRWAFFAGFGLLMAASTILLSFYVGAAVLAVLFPLYILIACDSDVSVIQGASKDNVSLGQIPIFKMALWPTQKLVYLLFSFRKKP